MGDVTRRWLVSLVAHIVMLGLVGLSGHAAAAPPQPNGAPPPSPVQVGGVVPEPPRPAWLASDPGLAKPVTIDLDGRPLREVLDALHHQTSALLDAVDGMLEYRLTIHAHQASISAVMGRVVDAWAHGKLGTPSVEWHRDARDPGAIRYQLRRTADGAKQEEQAVDAPRATVTRWLGDLRSYALASDDRRKGFATDCPPISAMAASGESLDSGGANGIGEALRAIGDADAAALLAIGRTSIKVADGRTAQAMLERGPDEGVFDLTVMGKGPAGRPLQLGLQLDTLGLAEPDAAVRATEDERDGKVGKAVALGSVLGPSGSGAKAVTMTTALAALSKATGIGIYAEVYLKGRRRLNDAAGTPQQLLTRICRTFGCNWVRVGNEYIVWSKTWAFDRRTDVPDRFVAPWLSPPKPGNDLVDLLARTASLSNGQLARLGDEVGLRAFTPLNVAAIRLLACVPASIRRQAFAADGVEVGSFCSAQPAQLGSMFGGKAVGRRLRLKLAWAPAASASAERLVIGFHDPDTGVGAGAVVSVKAGAAARLR